MLTGSSIFRRRTGPPPVVVRLEGEDPAGRTFVDPFRIGREESCEVQVPAGQASRCHAEVRFEEGAWYLVDLNSTNGTYFEGRRVDRLRLGRPAAVQLGRDGPRLTIAVEGSDAAALPAEAAVDSGPAPPPPPPERPEETHPATHVATTASAEPQRRPSFPETPASPPSAPPSGAQTQRPPSAPSQVPVGAELSARAPLMRPSGGASVPDGFTTRQIAHRYFGDGGDEPAGEHTQMIRRAYAHVQKRQRRRMVWVLAGALVITAAAISYALWQDWRVGRMERVAYELRAQEAEVARIRTALEQHFDASLQEQLEGLERQRAALEERYEGFIEEYGIRRSLSEEEQVIFKVARIFNESHTEMPPEFVRAVREQIAVWQTSGRSTIVDGIRHAEEQGYTGFIVRTMQEHDLPPEFFYLALQESNFRPQAVGPWTRFGHAKGMWQFIPETGNMYGLQIGPRAEEGVYDENDERHDFEKSTVAAARYLRDIYGYLAQASGLLAMASYNWGERRVIGKLNELMEGIPDDPEARSYWRFYTVYSDRMPQQTKDYVIKIFSAAVVGENPRLFGFDFDNPLRPYMEARPGRTAGAQ